MSWTPFKIKQYRILRGISQNKLAKDLGITQPTIAKLEIGNGAFDKHEKALNKSFKNWGYQRIGQLKIEIAYIKNFHK